MSEATPRRGWNVARAVVWALAAAVSALVMRGFLRGPRVGEDYKYFFPRMLDGFWWRLENGPLPVQWFTPSFCGGVPRVADGQDLSYALPQLLTQWVDPRDAAWGTAVIMALAGGAGFERLLSRAFGASPPVALLGGVVVTFNAAHEARSLAGHLAYHGMMLVPWACLGVAAPLPAEPAARRWRLAGDILLTGAVLAYLVSAGMLNMAAPLGLAVLATIFARASVAPEGELVATVREGVVRLAAGSALALALSAAKLAAFASYFSHFARDFYPLPGVAGALEAVSVTARAVFGWWAPSAPRIANSRFVVEAHELTYGVGPLPALGLAVGAVAWARGRRALGLSARRMGVVAALAAVLAVPFVINVYTPGWNALLKKLPVLSSSSLLFRWWLTYVFVAPLGLLGFERMQPRARALVCAAGVALTLVAALAKSRPMEMPASYDPSAVLVAWHQTRASGRPPPITAVSSARLVAPEDGGALVRGQSHQYCYDPTFGYRHERFIRGPLHLGPITDVRAGVLNLKNPACYVWPRENHCRPGDHFAPSQLAEMLRFASRRPFAFEMSSRQRVANAVTMAAWAGALALALTLAVRRVRRR